MSDRRRILGPNDAKIPRLGKLSGREAEKKQLPANDGVRKFFIKTGLTSNANGLAFLEVGESVVEVSVFGPRPIKGSFIDRASFSVETKFLPYITQPNEILYNGEKAQTMGRSGLTAIEQKISSHIETAFLPAIILEKYPKSTIDVFVNVLSFNSNTTSLLNLITWCVNCTLLAMVDSGIELRDLVTSGYASVTGNVARLDSPVCDDTNVECTASFLTMKNNEMTSLWVDGSDATEVTEDLLVKLTSACSEMSQLVRENINGYLLQLAQD